MSRRKPRLTTCIEDLAAALRACAAGLYATEAAVELLISHRQWLDRSDFVEVFVETGDGLVLGEPLAWVNWPSAIAALRAGRLACCGSDAHLLRVAASIADGIPVDLGSALTGLDEVNLTLVAQAVLHAGGRRGVTAVAGMVTR